MQTPNEGDLVKTILQICSGNMHARPCVNIDITEGAPDAIARGDKIILSIFENFGHVEVADICWDAPNKLRVLYCDGTRFLVSHLIKRAEKTDIDLYRIQNTKWE